MASEFWTRTRFLLMVLLLLSLSSVWSNVLSFNFALICMAPEANITTTDNFKFAESETTLLTSIVAIGALAANFPIVHLIHTIGIRSVFSCLGLVSGLATLAIPSAIRMGLVPLLLCRFLQGVSFAAVFPVIGSFSTKWTYYKQTGLFVSVLVSYVQLSPVITMPSSGALCQAVGWPAVFYVHGSASLLLFAALSLLYRNSPNKHPFVGARECSKISMGKSIVDKRTLRRLPYLAICSTPAIWAVWLAAVGNFAAVNLLFLYNPVYLSKVLGFSTTVTGAAAAFPPLAQFIVKLACGIASDRIQSISELAKHRLFNSIAFLGSAACFTALALIDGSNPSLNLCLLLCATGVLGAVTGGFYKAAAVLSKQYSHFVTGNLAVVLTATMLTVPLLVGSLTTPTSDHDDWKAVFAVIAATLVLSNSFFCFFITGEPCEWTKDDWIHRNSVKDLAKIEKY